MRNLKPATPISESMKEKSEKKLKPTPKGDDVVTNYFIISYKKKKTDSTKEGNSSRLKFKQMPNIPEIIYSEEQIPSENMIEFRKVFKYTYKNEKKNTLF